MVWLVQEQKWCQSMETAFNKKRFTSRSTDSWTVVRKNSSVEQEAWTKAQGCESAELLGWCSIFPCDVNIVSVHVRTSPSDSTSQRVMDLPRGCLHLFSSIFMLVPTSGQHLILSVLWAKNWSERCSGISSRKKVRDPPGYMTLGVAFKLCKSQWS